MLLIGDKVVSTDIIEKYFCCDLERCLGQCCVEGDAGAPVSKQEAQRLEEVLPQIKDMLSPAAIRVIEEQGVSYRDRDGELVTSIVDGRECVFTTFASGGVCLCALEAAYRQGRIPMLKPMSCHLYPIRITDYASFTALNYHNWKICKPACVLGRRKGLRVYEALREPLIRAYGEKWYEELAITAREYLKVMAEKD